LLNNTILDAARRVKRVSGCITQTVICMDYTTASSKNAWLLSFEHSCSACYPAPSEGWQHGFVHET